MGPWFDMAPGAYLMLALLLLTLPLPWLLASLAAAAIHELCHFGAVRLCGGEVRRLEADLGGLRMEIPPLPPGRELLCALAGPLGSFLLLPLLPILPRTALCGLAQGIFNLLPLYPFDGGRALRCAASLLLPEAAAERAVRWTEGLFLIALATAGFLLKWGFLTLVLPLSLFLRAKTPCKTAPGRIQ